MPKYTTSLFKDKGCGKTLVNSLQKRWRMTSSDLIFLSKTEKRLHFSESAIGNPLDNVNCKQNVVQTSKFFSQLNMHRLLGRGRAEVPIVYIFNPLHQENDETIGNLTLLVSPPVNKGSFLFTILKKNYLVLSAGPIPQKAFLFLESQVILVSITNQKIYMDSAKASD